MLVYSRFPAVFRNNNPDKGTETLIKGKDTAAWLKFRNNNPDKGTETIVKIQAKDLQEYV